ncbi:MAG: hypothetical protein AAB214_16560, partial [Fibrobacterota bacterium]
KKPVFGKVSENGAATFVGNAWVACDRVPQVILSAGQAAGADALSVSEEVLAGTFKPSSFYSYKADAVANVPSLVSANAGVGKINTDEYVAGLGTSPRSRTPLDASAHDGRILVRTGAARSVEILNPRGQIVSELVSGSGEVVSERLHAGLYLVRLGVHSTTVAIP